MGRRLPRSGIIVLHKILAWNYLPERKNNLDVIFAAVWIYSCRIIVLHKILAWNYLKNKTLILVGFLLLERVVEGLV
jgi:hypothetical protein